ncbi:MAG TPA: ribosomal protein S18-alanine N-acetyltransferase [Gemmatimonadales bacterium]|nr:ribosomal protein S18-alanine N-acetyltransferase [Gemmatimonadales bacterium]
MGDRWRIRPAELADADALARLERRCFSDPWSVAAFEELLPLSYVVSLVAEQGGKIGGYLIAREIAGEAEILNLAVDPDGRRGGLGRTLLEAGLAEVARRGATRVWLEVRESNAAARALYARRGFAAAGRRPRYYRAPVEDALVLSLDLSGAAFPG